MSIAMFAYDVAGGLNDGIAPMLGSLIGSMRVTKAKRFYRIVQVAAAFACIVIGLLIHTFRKEIYSAITDQEEIINVGL